MDCSIRNRNDKSEKNGESQRKQKKILKKNSKMQIIEHAEACVKRANAIYYIVLLALEHDEC